MISPFSHISVVLVRPQHAGNIGAAARAIVNHGLGTLFLVDPPSFDPDRARWMAPHSASAINSAKIVGDISTAIRASDCVIAATARTRKWSIPELSISEVIQKSKDQRIAILFGPEDSGLSNADIKQAHGILTFPTHAHQSLNLSQAVNILGAHFMASLPLDVAELEPIPPPPARKITVGLQDSIVKQAMNILGSCDYLNRKSPDKVYNQLMRLIHHSELSHDDTVMLKGMSNKIYHTLRIQKNLSKS